MAAGANVDDAMLLAAIRRRVLQDIEAGRREPGDATAIANNIYGGNGGGGGGGSGQQSPFGPGVAGSMGPASPDQQDDSDYFVDILRETIPEGGEVDLDGDKRKLDAGGWRKSVHRYKKKRMSE